MNDAQLKAGDAMYLALSHMPCTCRREHPYSGKPVFECTRCKSLTAWRVTRDACAACGNIKVDGLCARCDL